MFNLFSSSLPPLPPTFKRCFQFLSPKQCHALYICMWPVYIFRGYDRAFCQIPCVLCLHDLCRNPGPCSSVSGSSLFSPVSCCMYRQAVLGSGEGWGASRDICCRGTGSLPFLLTQTLKFCQNLSVGRI